MFVKNFTSCLIDLMYGSDREDGSSPRQSDNPYASFAHENQVALNNTCTYCDKYSKVIFSVMPR